MDWAEILIGDGFRLKDLPYSKNWKKIFYEYWLTYLCITFNMKGSIVKVLEDAKLVKRSLRFGSLLRYCTSQNRSTIVFSYKKIFNISTWYQLGSDKWWYTQLRTTFTFSSNTHLFKETRGHLYQFRERYFNFWILGYSLNYPFD